MGELPREPLTLPGTIMLGAADRRCGKTLFATELIRAMAAVGRVAGAKVTTVHERAGPCPRGDDGCGVCSSLEGPFSLSEELGGAEGKDTTRMLEAGARPVLWLCVRPGHLLEGAQELVDALARHGARSPAEARGLPVVCESNSLRKVVEPDLFVILRRRGKKNVKASCRAVEELADLVVEFDGESFDTPPEAFELVGGRWAVRREATAIVLAGGKSRRMGTDKALLPLDGRPVIEHVVEQLRPHFSEILVSADDAEKYRFLGLDVVRDREPGQGPMMAVASALQRSSHDINFVVPCDVPRLPRTLMSRILRESRGGEHVVVPVDPSGRYEPLFAVYKRGARRALDEMLAAGRRKITDIYDQCETRTVPLRPGEELRNMNTREEYEAFLEATR